MPPLPGTAAAHPTRVRIARALGSPSRAALTVGLMMLAAPAAVSQLGQTADGCAKTYGPPIQQLPAVIEGGDATAHAYRRKDLNITVHFKNGRAWHIAYAQAFLSDAEKAALLRENAGTAGWRRELGDRVGNIMLWLTNDNSVVVTAFEIPNLMLVEVMTRACADELARQRTQRILAARTSASGAAAQPTGSK